MHPLAFATGRHDARAPQISQVPRDFRLRLLKDLHKVADANFLISHQVEQAKAGIVAERLKEQFHVKVMFSSHA